MSDAGTLHRTQPKFGKGPIDLLLDKSVSDGAVRQYVYMHWRYGANKTNFEGRESIAEAMGVEQRTVTNRNIELEAANWIVVTRTYDRKARKTRNFYDVFEERADCLQWRIDNNRPKPQRKSTTRKLRTGKGGTPSHNPDSDLHSVSDHPQDSDLHSSADCLPVTDLHSGAGYLDTDSIQTQKDSADTPTAVSGGELVTPETPTGEHKLPTELTPFKDTQTAIIDAWFSGDWSNAAWAGDLAHMFMGTATKKAYKPYNFDPPFDAAKVRAWAAWLTSQSVELPTSPAKLLRWKGKFLASTGHKPAVSAPAAPNPLTNAYQDADRDCLACGGNGVFRDVMNQDRLCACVVKNREARHVSA